MSLSSPAPQWALPLADAAPQSIPAPKVDSRKREALREIEKGADTLSKLELLQLLDRLVQDEQHGLAVYVQALSEADWFYDQANLVILRVNLEGDVLPLVCSTVAERYSATAPGAADVLQKLSRRFSESCWRDFSNPKTRAVVRGLFTCLVGLRDEDLGRALAAGYCGRDDMDGATYLQILENRNIVAEIFERAHSLPPE